MLDAIRPLCPDVSFDTLCAASFMRCWEYCIVTDARNRHTRKIHIPVEISLLGKHAVGIKFLADIHIREVHSSIHIRKAFQNFAFMDLPICAFVEPLTKKGCILSVSGDRVGFCDGLFNITLSWCVFPP